MKILEHSILPFKIPINFTTEEDSLTNRVSVSNVKKNINTKTARFDGQKVVVKYMRSYAKKVEVVRVPAFWQQYIEDI